MTNACIHRFKSSIEEVSIPALLNNPFSSDIPDIAKLAANELQIQLEEKLNCNRMNETDYIKGKMFGILVINDTQNMPGYLAAYSGKWTGEELDISFVPSVFDHACGNYFIDKGMSELSLMGTEIKKLQNESANQNEQKIADLKQIRKIKSKDLQNELFSHYQFSNCRKEYKKLTAIFAAENKTPPAAAGECAAPKLLNYAFENGLKPIAVAEFWWGTSRGSMSRQHGHFYPACNDKCRPILNFMLA